MVRGEQQELRMTLLLTTSLHVPVGRMGVFPVLAFIRGNPTSCPSEGDRIQARVIVWADRNQFRDAFLVNASHVRPEEVEARVELELLPILAYSEAQRDEHAYATGN